MTQLRREGAPEAEAEHEKPTLRPPARADLSKTTTCAEAGESSEPRAARD